jgi:hypothetical protein
MLGANPPEPVESSMLTIYNSPGRRLRSPRRHELETLPLPQVDSRRAAQTIRDAVQLFLDDQAARGLESSSQKKYRTVLQNQLLVWMEKHKIMLLDRIMPADLTRFRATWHNGESTTHRKHEIINVLLRILYTQRLSAKKSHGSLEQAEDAGCSLHPERRIILDESCVIRNSSSPCPVTK